MARRFGKEGMVSLPGALVGAAILGVLLAASPPVTVFAQEAPEGPAPTEESVDEARERTSRGLRLFDEGRYDAALAEFHAAYRAAPNYRVLYNLGRVYEETGDAVRASEMYARYLEEGGDEVPTDRRQDVTARLEEQRTRVARVWIRSEVEGATVTLDGATVSRSDGTPLRLPMDQPLLITAGRHRVGVSAPNHAPAERSVDLAGGVEETLTFDLVPVTSNEATVRIHSPLVGVEVWVDGQSVGRTPLNASVAVQPGRLNIEGRRPGYRTQQRQLTVHGGSEVDVRLDLELDPDAPPEVLGPVRFRFPEAGHTLFIDGRVVSEPPTELPIGDHRVRLEVADRLPHESRITIQPNHVVEYAPNLLWTPDARQARRSEHGTLRTWGWIATVSGGALLLGLGPLFVHAHTRATDLDTEGEQLSRLSAGCPGNPGFDPQCVVDGRRLEEPDFRSELQDIESSRKTWYDVRAVAAIGASVGAALLITGIVLLSAGGSDDADSDERVGGAVPRLALHASWNQVALTGQF